MSEKPAAEALGVAVAAGVPVLLWGAPGTGKTSAIRAMAEAMGLPCETVIASIREPSDFAGLPIVVGGGHQGECAPAPRPAPPAGGPRRARRPPPPPGGGAGGGGGHPAGAGRRRLGPVRAAG